jgi:uncharacterized membrane protein YvbJ
MPGQPKVQGGEMMITCQACGTENPPDTSFCVKCARKLDPETQSAVVRQRSSYVAATGVRWPAVASATVLVIVVVLVVLLVTHVI